MQHAMHHAMHHTLRRRWLWITVTILVLTLAGGGMVLAQSGANINLEHNTATSANAGGSVMNSTSFQLVMSVGGGAMETSSSASYQVCTGFICGVPTVFRLQLPTLRRD